jgi:glycosyltransferase involved in cell wall biosynthesis
MRSLSVFFPAYNEEENIKNTVEKAHDVLKNEDFKWEIIVIDDGSKDKTGEIADKLAKELKNVRVVHQPNGGYGMALRAGFKNAQYEWIAFTDADGQFDFSEIGKLIAKTDKADLVMGYRIKRSDPFFRLVMAFGWKTVIFLFFGTWFKDIDCAFKIINKKIFETIAPLESTRGGMISPELVLKAKQKGFRIAQVGVHHYPRLYGSPTGSNMKVILISFRDLFRLRMKL